ncbi:MAG: redox-sensing transcriptional repressor Rex [Acidimicrobiia bacterium]|nr:redox-sensing transcriptional repressor Rex [Acidimicrobiia bacterium]MBP8179915.1 redox-sensing transcriptional repressor Rex [Acidimicrobiia bacterium]
MPEQSSSRSGPTAEPSAAGRTNGNAQTTRRIPEATVSRLPLYYRSLLTVAADRTTTVSSERLAELAHVSAAQVRKDLSRLGSYGTRGVGYEVPQLLRLIRDELGLNQTWRVIVVGAGNLGRALSQYEGFRSNDFEISALVDSDPAKIGTMVGNLTIESVDDLGTIVAERNIRISILATPAEAAQKVADLLVEAGVISIMNLAPAILDVPDGVLVRKADLATELQILSFYQHHGRVDLDGSESDEATP